MVIVNYRSNTTWTDDKSPEKHTKPAGFSPTRLVEK